MSTGNAERVDLVKLAKAQQQLLHAIGLVFLLLVAQIAAMAWVEERSLARWAFLGLTAMQLAMSLATISLAVRMSRAAAVGWGMTASLCVALLVPFLNIMMLAVLNSRVLSLLGQRRVKIGLMGVPRDELRKLVEGTCVCGYDLRGLERPVCPECGSPIAAAGEPA